MQIILNKPRALSEKGRSHHNEDCLCPAPGKARATSRYFVVCDGMGGHQHGEVASRTVCDAFADALNGPAQIDAVDRRAFDRALAHAYAQLDRQPAQEIEKKMGTTLVFLAFHPGGALAAHIGDSRIYHLRRQGAQTGILYKSRDHSYVNDLVRAHIITPEEAVTHAKRNIVTRAMQPQQERPAQADVHETDDVRPGDCFFLCSDGVLEAVDDDLLCRIIADSDDDRTRIDAIRDACRQRSHDNFSACLVSVRDVRRDETDDEIADRTVIGVSASPEQPAAASEPTDPPRPRPRPSHRQRNVALLVAAIVLVIVLGILGYLYLRSQQDTTGFTRERNRPETTGIERRRPKATGTNRNRAKSSEVDRKGQHETE
jgi:protein phosphatase